MRREFNRHYLSLMHFDFPYYAEPGDGCRDEIALLSWERMGSAKFAGNQIPCDEIFSPKFGYRCMHTQSANDYLRGTGNISAFTVNSTKKFSLECFIYPEGPGNIFTLFGTGTEEFAVKLTDSNKIQVSGKNFIVSSSNNTADISLKAWHYIKIAIFSDSVKIYIDGAQKFTSQIAGMTGQLTYAKLGGFNGYMDEFLIQDTFDGVITAPGEPHKGTLDIESIGGYGDAKHGIANFTANNSNLIINTGANISSIASPDTFTCAHIHTHTHGNFEAGDEVMILLKQKYANIYQDAGLYSFRHVKSISGKKITLDSPVTEFTFNSSTASNYRVEIYKVPNYSSFTLGENTILRPYTDTLYGANLVIFRTTGDCNIKGRILTRPGKYKYYRQDLLQMTNSDLPERFLFNTNGGVYIVCGGKFTAGSSARIGGDYPGDKEGGWGTKGQAGTNGGAGYGGGGGSSPTHLGQAGTGGVGGGGGAADKGTSGNAGDGGNTGGFGLNSALTVNPGGTQGRTPGGSASSTSDSGGGGAGGNAYNNIKRGGLAGACVLIACRKLSCDAAAVSTGGEGGYKLANSAGGGGTGFCYIACEEMI